MSSEPPLEALFFATQDRMNKSERTFSISLSRGNPSVSSSTAAAVGGESGSRRRVCLAALIPAHVVFLRAAARQKHRGEGRHFTGRWCQCTEAWWAAAELFVVFNIREVRALRKKGLGADGEEEKSVGEEDRRPSHPRICLFLSRSCTARPSPAGLPDALPFIVRTVCMCLHCCEYSSRLVGFI